MWPRRTTHTHRHTHTPNSHAHARLYNIITVLQQLLCAGAAQSDGRTDYDDDYDGGGDGNTVTILVERD